MNNTTIRLINYSELAPNNNKTLSFDDIQDQEAFFTALADFTFLPEQTDFRRVKENATVKLKLDYETSLKYNYMMYKNNNKWFYAYIVGVQYISPDVTSFDIQTDVLQTYMFDYEVAESFVEREHSNRFISDGAGGVIPMYNTIDEALDYGNDYTVRSEIIEDDNIPEYSNGTKHNLAWVYIYTKEALCAGSPPKARYYGINSNLIVYVAPVLLQDGLVIGAPIYKVGNALDGFFNAFSTSDIATISENANVLTISYSRMPPTSYTFTETPSGTFNFTLTPFGDFPLCSTITNVNGRGFLISNITTDIDITTIEKETFNPASITINTQKSRWFEPKMFTYPYKFKKFNAYGNALTIKNEHIDGITLHNVDVKIKGSKIISQTFDETFKLTNYLGGQGFLDSNKNNMIVTNANNQINLRTDAWNEYVSRNKSSLTSGLVTAGLQTAGAVALGVATGGIGLAVAGSSAISTGFSIFNQLQKRKDIKNTPDEIKDGAGDIMVNRSIHNLYLSLDTYEITSEYANRLFNYFYYYGYKVSTYKTPELRNRYYFNYVKTIDTRIESDLPHNIVEQIKQHYENGLTIYHVRDINNFSVETQKENLEMFLV